MIHIQIDKHQYLSEGEIMFLKAFIKLEKNDLAFYSEVEKASGLKHNNALGFYGALSKKAVLERRNLSFIGKGIMFEKYAKSTH